MSNNINVLCFALGGFAWLTLMPYFVWSSQYVLVLGSIILVLTCFYGVLLNKLAIQRKDLYFMIVWLIASLLLLHPGLYNGASLFGYMFITLTVSVLFASSDSVRVKAFYWFRLLFVLSLIPGMLVWTAQAAGISVDFIIIDEIVGDDMLNNMKAQKNTFYYEFPGSVVLNYMMDYPVFRMSAMYDEPGVVGTFSVLFLVADNMNFRKWYNIILFIGGVMSLSFAFAVIIVLYFMVLMIHKPVMLIFLVPFFLAVIILTQNFEHQVLHQFNQQIVDRLSITSEDYSNVSRSGPILDYNFERWLVSDLNEIFFGCNENLENDGSSHWKTIPVNRGLLGVLALFIMILLIACRYYAGLPSILFVGLFCLSIYQRPMVWNLPYLMLFVGGCLNLKHKSFRNYC